MKTRRFIRCGAVLSAVVLSFGILCGCSQSSAAVITDISVKTNRELENPGKQDKNKADINHGHSISETAAERPREIKRSYDVIYTADEALEFLKKCVQLQSDDYTFKLSDTSDDDPGAYMWYDFTVYYKGTAVDNSAFTVIAFTDGTIAEGREEFLTCTMADKSKVLSKDKALSQYKEKTNDKRKYKYKDAYYFFSGKAYSVCPYVYVYRYDCGDILENCTLLIDAETGERVGIWPDAIS